mmetsp:Transcript_27688/g.69817  ORF Transcript_27688/g.69817 Transcript_27688/m.69817 type:complete len:483 (+) Transcript_27688:2498-3946(+)
MHVSSRFCICSSALPWLESCDFFLAIPSLSSANFSCSSFSFSPSAQASFSFSIVLLRSLSSRTPLRIFSLSALRPSASTSIFFSSSPTSSPFAANSFSRTVLLSSLVSHCSRYRARSSSAARSFSSSTTESFSLFISAKSSCTAPCSFSEDSASCSLSFSKLIFSLSSSSSCRSFSRNSSPLSSLAFFSRVSASNSSCRSATNSFSSTSSRAKLAPRDADVPFGVVLEEEDEKCFSGKLFGVLRAPLGDREAAVLAGDAADTTAGPRTAENDVVDEEASGALGVGAVKNRRPCLPDALLSPMSRTRSCCFSRFCSRRRSCNNSRRWGSVEELSPSSASASASPSRSAASSRKTGASVSVSSCSALSFPSTATAFRHPRSPSLKPLRRITFATSSWVRPRRRSRSAVSRPAYSSRHWALISAASSRVSTAHTRAQVRKHTCFSCTSSFSRRSRTNFPATCRPFCSSAFSNVSAASFAFIASCS